MNHRGQVAKSKGNLRSARVQTGTVALIRRQTTVGPDAHGLPTDRALRQVVALRPEPHRLPCPVRASHVMANSSLLESAVVARGQVVKTMGLQT